MKTKRSTLFGVVFAFLLVFSFGSMMILSAQRSATPAAPPQPSGVVPPAPALQVDGELVVQERFDAAVAWDQVDDTLIKEYQASWGVANGQLRLQAPAAGPNLDPAIYLMPTVFAGDTTLSAQFYPQGNQAVGLVFGHSDAGYYSFRVFADESDLRYRATLDRIDAQGLTRLAEVFADTQSGYLYNTWQTLAVERTGSTITAFFGSELLFQVQDSALGAGQVGVYAANMGDVAVDNVTVAR